LTNNSKVSLKYNGDEQKLEFGKSIMILKNATFRLKNKSNNIPAKIDISFEVRA